MEPIPYMIKDTLTLEKVQRQATKFILRKQGRSHQNLSGQVEVTGFNLWCLWLSCLRS